MRYAPIAKRVAPPVPQDTRPILPQRPGDRDRTAAIIELQKQIAALSKRLDAFRSGKGAKGDHGEPGKDGKDHTHTLNLIIKRDGKVLHTLKVKLDRDVIDVEIPIEGFVK